MAIREAYSQAGDGTGVDTTAVGAGDADLLRSQEEADAALRAENLARDNARDEEAATVKRDQDRAKLIAAAQAAKVAAARALEEEAAAARIRVRAAEEAQGARDRAAAAARRIAAQAARERALRLTQELRARKVAELRALKAAAETRTAALRARAEAARLARTGHSPSSVAPSSAAPLDSLSPPEINQELPGQYQPHAAR